MGQDPHPDGSYGWTYFGDDFTGYNALTSSGGFGKGPYYGFIEDSGTIASLTTDLGGVIQLATGDTADDSISFGLGQIAGMLKVAVGTPGVVTGKGGKVLFEARFRLPSVTDAAGSAYIGLGEVGLIANDGNISDTHALGQKDLLGFWVLDSDGDRLNFGYNVTSGTAQVVGYTALTAATFIKAGFVYDPEAPSSKRITWFVDGAEQASYVTGATVGEKTGNAGEDTFPAGVHMSPMAEVKTDGAAAHKLDIDWWHVAMQRLG